MIYKVPAATLVLCTSIEISERICRGMDILESPGLDMKEEDVKRMQSVQYALAVKFLDRNQLMDVKEKIGMTILGSCGTGRRGRGRRAGAAGGQCGGSTDRAGYRRRRGDRLTTDLL